MQNSLISVIMSVYREEPLWLRESIESILNQSYEKFEFIIVLDDPENKVLKRIIEEYVKKDDRIVFVTNDANRGLVYSLNRALAIAKGDFVARMDADDIAHTERFAKQLSYLKENDLDLIGSNVNLFRGKKRDIFFTTNKLLTHKYLKKILVAGTIGIVHPTFFGTREIFEKLDGYTNAPHAEDKEFLARVFCRGYRVGNIKEVLLDCRYSPNSVTKKRAVYVKIVGDYITECFRECQRNRNYFFDESLISSMHISKKKEESFNKKRILLDRAREALNERRYIGFIIQISKAFYHSGTLLDNIRINLLLKYYRFVEEIETKGVW